MTFPVAVRFDHVVKTYPGYQQVTGGIKTFLFHPYKSFCSLRQRTLALDNISLEIKQGETFAFIGNNGVGKSTTLGLIAGVLHPDSGTVTVNGRVSPLLELGAGFHPELTGRENIRLNGVLLGLCSHEVEEHLEEIIEFSTLGHFIDHPVRTYSSGMYAKLGFSVIASLQPEILLVDEVLAVGDYIFIKRCQDKMEQFRTDPAITTIMVTHSLPTVSALCDRAAWVENHRVRMIGPADDVAQEYIKESERSLQSLVPAQISLLPPHLTPSHEQLCFQGGAASLGISLSPGFSSCLIEAAVLNAAKNDVLQCWRIEANTLSVFLVFQHDGNSFALYDGSASTPKAAQGLIESEVPATAEAPLLLRLALLDAQGNLVSPQTSLPLSLTSDARKQHEAYRASLFPPFPLLAQGGEDSYTVLPPSRRAPLWTSGRTVRLVARNIFPRDAVGRFALDAARLFLHSGVDVRLYAYVFPAELSGSVHPVSRLQNDMREQDLLFYNYSIEDEFLPGITALPGKKVLYYHNVTPASYFQAYSPEFAEILKRSREQYSFFAAFDSVLANSAFSLQELTGFVKEGIFSAVCPPFLAPTVLESAHISKATAPPPAGKFLLWVGRVVPHKRPDWALRLFAALADQMPDLSLIMVGTGCNDFPTFSAELETIVASMPKDSRQRIHCMENISSETLKALYNKATALLSTSLHEGFCIPLYEAMRCGTAIFATPQAAMGETLGEAFLCLEGEPETAVETCLQSLKNSDFLRMLQQKGFAQGRKIAENAAGEQIWDAVGAALLPGEGYRL